MMSASPLRPLTPGLHLAQRYPMFAIIALLAACSPATETATETAACPPEAVTDTAESVDSAPTHDSTPVEECAPQAWYLDCDADGMGRAPVSLEYAAVIACDGDQPEPDDERCAWVSVGGDCDDTTGTVKPFGTETCDGRDNDCDGYADEGFDTDGDGLADCNGPTVCP